MMSTMMIMLHHDPGTSTKSLRALLYAHYPIRKGILAQDIFNVRVRANLLYDKYFENGSLKLTKVTMNILTKGLDDIDSDIIYQESKHVHRIVHAALSEGEKAIFL